MRVLTCGRLCFMKPLLFVVVLFCHSLLANELDVRVVGLFQDRALININGNQRFMKLNEQSPEGVKLIAASPERAVVDIAGTRHTLTMSSDVRTNTTPAEVRRVQISKSNAGMYMTTGAINGIPVTMLVDTGASSIAMNTEMAQRLGVPFRHVGTKIHVSTANGGAVAWRVKLKSVKVGEVERFNVDAAVIEGAATQEILLGMSFLSTVKMKEENNLLILEAVF